MNPLAQQMQQLMMAQQGQGGMPPQAPPPGMQMSPQIAPPPPPDYVDHPDPMASAMAAQRMQKMPFDQRPGTDAEIYKFIEDLKKERDSLPNSLKLKLDNLLITVEGGAPKNEAGWDIWEEEQGMKGR